jgi:hypothetical protein
MSAQPTKKCR